MKTPAAKKDALIAQMIRCLNTLGNDCMARIDARIWAEFFVKKAKRLKIKL